MTPRHLRAAGQWWIAACRAKRIHAVAVGEGWKSTDDPSKVTCPGCKAKNRQQNKPSQTIDTRKPFV